MERSEVMWGTTKIPYEIRRSERRATVSLAIDPADGLVVTAPRSATISRLDAVVKTKALWIVQRLRRRSDLPPAPPEKELVSGEGFSYLGRHFRVRVVTGHPATPVLRRGWLEVKVPRALSVKRRQAHVRQAIVGWFVTRARERLPAWASAWATTVGVPLDGVVITEQAKRWGSCSRGIVRINWRIVQAPRKLVEYVLAHEVVHLAHGDHGRKFWSALGRVMPDYEERRERLKQVGASLVW